MGKKEKQISILILIFLLISYSYFIHFIGRESWNATSRLALTYSLAEQGTVRIDAYQAQTGDKVFYRGHYYSDKAPGASLIAVPFYLLLKWLGVNSEKFMRYGLTLLVIGVSSALGSVFLYRLTGLFEGYRLRNRVLVTLIYGLGTLAYPFSTVFYGHQFAAALTMVSFYLLFAIKKKQSAGILTVVLSGFFAGLAFLSDFPAAIILFLLAVYGFFFLPSRKTFIVWVLGAAVPVCFLGWYNRHCFGSALTFSYALHSTYSHGQGLLGINWPDLNALWGITFSPYRGIFYQSPVLLAVIPGFYLWWRRKTTRPELGLSLLITAGFFFFNAGYDYWDGVGSVGARFLIPALPFLCLGLLEAGRRWSGTVLSLGLISVLFMLVITATEPRVEWNVKSPLFYFNFFLLFRGLISDNLGMLAGLKGLFSLIPLTVVMIIFSGIVIKMSSGPRRGRFFGRRLLGSAGISAMVVLWLILAGWERPVLREYDKAESLFRYYRSRGEIYWEPIINHYRRSIEADPGFLNPYLRLAQIARGRGRLRLALRYYQNLIEQAPGRIDLRREIASIYRELGESENAEEELLNCLELSPENVFVRNQLAEFYWASGRPEKAITQLEESLRIKKDKRVMEQLRRIRQLRQAAENDK